MSAVAVEMEAQAVIVILDRYLLLEAEQVVHGTARLLDVQEEMGAEEETLQQVVADLEYQVVQE